MKRFATLLICVLFIHGTALVAEALTCKFEGNILGVPFLAGMEVSASRNMLTFTMNNLSPESFGPTIYGFGVALKNYSAVAGEGIQKEFIAGGMDVSQNWNKPGLIYGGNVYQLYYLAANDYADSLFNPKSEQFDENENSSTPAVFRVKFKAESEEPLIDESIAPVIRVGNVFSPVPQYVTGKFVVAPEPGTLLLLGLGLIGLAVILREIRR